MNKVIKNTTLTVFILSAPMAQAIEIIPINLDGVSTSTPAVTSTSSGTSSATSGAATGDKKAKCKLSSINAKAREAMGSKNIKIIEEIFEDPEFKEGLANAGSVANSCISDLGEIWKGISGDYKMGSGLNGILGDLINFNPNTVVQSVGNMAEGAINDRLENACQQAKDQVNEMFGNVSDLLTQKLDMGALGEISTESIIGSGSSNFKFNVKTPSTSTISTYFDNIWK